MPGPTPQQGGARRRARPAAPASRGAATATSAKRRSTRSTTRTTRRCAACMSEKGKIRSRRITGTCRRHQQQVGSAIKRAREMALLPYVGTLRRRRWRSSFSRTSPTSARRATSPPSRKGYARNYLLPRGLAEVGDARQDRRVPAPRGRAQVARGAHGRAGRGDHGHAQPHRAHACARRPARASGSSARSPPPTSPTRIKDARGYTIDKRKVLLDEPIKELGTFMVDVEVADGFVASVKTIVVPE